MEQFTTGVIISLEMGEIYLVVSGQSYSMEGFENHIHAIFNGNYSDCRIRFIADIEAARKWREEQDSKHE